MTESPPDQRAAVAALFDRTADTYDDVGVDFFKPIAERLLAAIDPRPGERAVDMGCGRGAVLLPLARAVGPTGSVVGLDLAPKMVSATAAGIESAGLAGIAEARVGDVQEPDLPPRSFDLVVSSAVLFFLPDPEAALRQWRRLLVAGGRVGVSTFGEYSPHWKAVDSVFAPYVPKQMLDPRTQPEESPFASDVGVERLLESAGFTDVRTESMTLHARFEDEDHWHRWTWSVGQRRMWEAVPEADREAVRTAAYEQLQNTRDQEGRIGFDQVVRFTLART